MVDFSLIDERKMIFPPLGHQESSLEGTVNLYHGERCLTFVTVTLAGHICQFALLIFLSSPRSGTFSRSNFVDGPRSCVCDQT
jgi:hypothetical protein